MPGKIEISAGDIVRNVSCSSTEGYYVTMIPLQSYIATPTPFLQSCCLLLLGKANFNAEIQFYATIPFK
jgi:hypothetical protein